MKKIPIFTLAILTLPLSALAQVANYQGVSMFAINTLQFINSILVPTVFAIAFLVFIWGIFKAFIVGGDDEKEQSKGKQLMFYAIIGFVVMVSVWGIVNLVAQSFGFSGQPLQQIPSAPLPGGGGGGAPAGGSIMGSNSNEIPDEFSALENIIP